MGKHKQTELVGYRHRYSKRVATETIKMGKQEIERNVMAPKAARLALKIGHWSRMTPMYRRLRRKSRLATSKGK